MKQIPQDLYDGVVVCLQGQLKSWEKYIARNPGADWADNQRLIVEDLLKRLAECG